MSCLISRRAVLKGMGAAVALPWLEAMLPKLSLAASAAKAPVRMAFLYVPNGMHMPDWTPSKEGKDFELPATLQPLAAFKDDMLVMTGLTADKARPNGDGPGDHARAMGAFLTGVQPKKTAGADIRCGVSVDQIAAQTVGQLTRFPSLEIGCEGGRQVGNCDSGYSCAYSSTIAWKSDTTPLVKEVNPRAVFERLFGKGSANSSLRDRYQRSILDNVAEDAQQLRGSLGLNDQRKLDEYLTSIREIELRIAKTATEQRTAGDAPTYSGPAGVPREYADHLRLLADMLVLAFQADLTRVSTFVFANDGSNRNYRQIDVPEGHHDLSHHGNDKAKQTKIQKINTFHTTQLAYLIGKFKAVKEGERTLLDNCMVMYGGGIGDGNRHNHDDLPIAFFGKAGGTIATGRHVRYPRNTPLNNLYLSMLDRMGVSIDKLGDSKGRLETLEI